MVTTPFGRRVTNNGSGRRGLIHISTIHRNKIKTYLLTDRAYHMGARVNYTSILHCKEARKSVIQFGNTHLNATIRSIRFTVLFIDYSRIVLIIGDLNGLGHLPEFPEQILNRKQGSCKNFRFDLLGKFW